MTSEEQNFQILEAALAELDSGKSPEEILAMFPQQRAELAEIFSDIKKLGHFKNDLRPSPALMSKILRALPRHEKKLGWAQRLKTFLAESKFIAFPVTALLVLLVVTGLKAYSPMSTTPDEVSKTVLQESTVEQSIISGGNEAQLVKTESQAAQDFSNVIHDNEY